MPTLLPSGRNLYFSSFLWWGEYIFIPVMPPFTIGLPIAYGVVSFHEDACVNLSITGLGSFLTSPLSSYMTHGTMIDLTWGDAHHSLPRRPRRVAPPLSTRNSSQSRNAIQENAACAYSHS